MLNDSFSNWKQLRKTIDLKTQKTLLFSTLLGIAVANVEFGFALVLQEFLFRIGLLNAPSPISQKLPTGVYFGVAATLVVGLARTCLQALRLYTSRLTQQVFANTQRQIIIQKVLTQINRVSTAESLAVFNDEVQRGGLAIMNLSFFLIAMSSSIILLATLFSVSFKASLLSFFFLGVLIIPIRIFNRLASLHGKALTEQWARTNDFFVNGIRNNFYFKVYDLVQDVINKASWNLDRYLSSYRATFKLLAIKSVFPTYLGLVLICMVALVMRDNTGLSEPAKLLAFFYIFLRFTQEASASISAYSEFCLNSASLKNIRCFNSRFNSEFNGSLQQPGPAGTRSHKSGPITRVKAEDLHFGYNTHEPIISKINFDLQPGDCMVVTGPSGSGKSTLLALILGLETPTSGRIQLNETDAFFRKQVETTAYVGPIPFLIDGTIQENLLYAHPNASSVTDNEVHRALDVVELSGHIQSLPGGLEARIDENANTFSSGQKQRLMLARGILRKPSLLILDEATSNLDLFLEKKIVSNIAAMASKMIVIAVTHRSELKSICTLELQFD